MPRTIETAKAENIPACPEKVGQFGHCSEIVNAATPIKCKDFDGVFYTLFVISLHLRMHFLRSHGIFRVHGIQLHGLLHADNHICFVDPHRKSGANFHTNQGL